MYILITQVWVCKKEQEKSCLKESKPGSKKLPLISSFSKIRFGIIM